MCPICVLSTCARLPSTSMSRFRTGVVESRLRPRLVIPRPPLVCAFCLPPPPPFPPRVIFLLPLKGEKEKDEVEEERAFTSGGSSVVNVGNFEGESEGERERVGVGVGDGEDGGEIAAAGVRWVTDKGSCPPCLVSLLSSPRSLLLITASASIPACSSLYCCASRGAACRLPPSIFPPFFRREEDAVLSLPSPFSLPVFASFLPRLLPISSALASPSLPPALLSFFSTCFPLIRTDISFLPFMGSIVYER